MFERCKAAEDAFMQPQGAQRTSDLDLDLLAVGDYTINDPDLIVPHPQFSERAFVLIPWAEVDPDFEVLGHGRVGDILDAATDEHEVRRPRRRRHRVARLTCSHCASHPVSTLLWVALAAIPVGWSIGRVVDAVSNTLPPVPILPLLLAFLALLLFVGAYAVRGWVQERRYDRRLDALRIARLLALGKRPLCSGPLSSACTWASRSWRWVRSRSRPAGIEPCCRRWSSWRPWWWSLRRCGWSARPRAATDEDSAENGGARPA